MTFTPALGRFAPTRFYDAVVTLTRERLWRALVVAYAAPRPGDVIVDVGCGTGSLALLLARAEPQAQVIGLDPDLEVLAIARTKRGPAQVGPVQAGRAEGGLAKGGSGIRWLNGTGDAAAELVGAGEADIAVSSLVLHQCPIATKRAVLASMFAVLRPGGRLVIADYGRQRTPLMRLAFKTVQFADGKADTQPNADGVLPELIADAGFHDVREAEVVATVTGSISIYVARRD